MSVTSLIYRKTMSQSDFFRDMDCPEPEGLAKHENISYGPFGEWNLMDLYLPEEAEERVPVIIFVHGGRWVYGDKEVSRPYCLRFASHGFAVVNYTYRLAPEYSFPAPIEDLNLVIRWIKRNGAKYNLDLNAIFFVGEGEGAHLAMLYTCLLTNAEYAQKYHFPVAHEFCPRAIVLNGGIYNVRDEMEDRLFLKDFVRDFLGKNYAKSTLKMIEPCRYLSNGFPFTFVCSSTGDIYKTQAKYLNAKLVKRGVPYRYRIYGTRENKVKQGFSLNLHTAEAKECMEEEAAFLKSFLRGGELRKEGFGKSTSGESRMEKTSEAGWRRSPHSWKKPSEAWKKRKPLHPAM